MYFKPKGGKGKKLNFFQSSKPGRTACIFSPMGRNSFQTRIVHHKTSKQEIFIYRYFEIVKIGYWNLSKYDLSW